MAVWLGSVVRSDSLLLTNVKSCQRENQVPLHYDPTLPVSLACDVTAYGLGAGILHPLPWGGQRPTAYASGTLSPTKTKY